MTDCAIVAAGDSDASGDADCAGVALGSAAMALTHANAIVTKNTRVAFINYDYIDALHGNAKIKGKVTRLRSEPDWH